MLGMFYGAQSFDQNLGSWNVSNVTNMRAMFAVTNFDQDISEWDVSSVTDMGWMFFEASSFNQPIGSWDVSNVTDMRSMFEKASSFNQPIGDWNVANVTTLYQTFSSSTAFDQPLDSWNIGNVTNMGGTFAFAESFNQPLASWNTQITWMHGVFAHASSFNQDISDWDVSNATNTRMMFSHASSFNQDISDWNVSNVTNMELMFENATTFNQPIGDWNVSNVTQMASMFEGASAFDSNLDSWDVGLVINMQSMFKNASSFNQNISFWDTSNVLQTDSMFEGATSFDQDLSMWNITSVTTMEKMFEGITLSTMNYDSILSGWSSQTVQNGILFGAGNSQFCYSIEEREKLVNEFSWIISDGGNDPECDVPVIDISISDYDESSVLLSVMVSNFEIGIDGHWHYSINGGQTQMVYNTEDIILSNLNQGSNTITAWLVDNNHMNLEPHASNTVSFNIDNSGGLDNSCYYTIRLMDSYGDGYNGNTFNLYVNGQLISEGIGSDFTEGSEITYELNIGYGDLVQLDYILGPANPTTWPEENSLAILDDTGAVVYSWSFVEDGDNGLSFSCNSIYDTTIPVITLLGEEIVSQEVGTAYTDAGATATDDYDGDLTSSIVVTGSVDTNIVGTYILSYDVTDPTGNAATTVTRTVNVVDTTAPVITLLGEETVTLEVGATYTDAGATATDNYDGSAGGGVGDSGDNTVSPLTGAWKLAPEAGAISVGPVQGMPAGGQILLMMLLQGIAYLMTPMFLALMVVLLMFLVQKLG